jgi:hypothetical protein
VKVSLVPARLTHIGPIAVQMRDADRHECEAFGRSPKQALRISLRTSLHALTALDDDGPVCMLGVCPGSLITGKGVPWMLGTDRMFDHATDLMRHGPRVLAWWLREFETLENIVSTDNEAAIRLLRYWGAEVGSAERMHRGVAFVPFQFERGAIQAPALAA